LSGGAGFPSGCVLAGDRDLGVIDVIQIGTLTAHRTTATVHDPQPALTNETPPDDD